MTEAGDVHPYATLAYARTLEHVGEPRLVAAWKTYVLRRSVKAGGTDITGPYPLTEIEQSADLVEGLRDLENDGYVSATLVCDHLGGSRDVDFRRVFPISREFKRHFIVDRDAGHYRPNKHHQSEIRRAERRGVVVRGVQLENVLSEWTDLYEELVERHSIAGAPRFTSASFLALAKCTGLRMVGAFLGDVLVGGHLWFVHRGVVWSHLGASNELGRQNGASYAIYDYSIKRFENAVISLGGAAGLGECEGDGLAMFKEGFANRRIVSYLYGSVFDPDTYAMLCLNLRGDETDYFPAYRSQSGCHPNL